MAPARSLAALSPAAPRAAGSPRTDGEILRACQRGDEEAFAELVQRYSTRAYWVAHGLLGHAEDARDVVQEAFVRVHRALDRFDFSQSFYTWLYRIVVNLSIDRLRKRRGGVGIALDDVAEPRAEGGAGDSPDRILERAETAREVREVLDTLPEKYRTVMVLRELNGLSCKEIAGIVGASHATVRWRLHIARKQFRDAWERRSRRREVEGVGGGR